MPPETLKDTMTKGHIPTIYLLSSILFDDKSGTSVVEFQIPAFYSYFYLKQRITLITDSEGEKAIKEIFKQTFLSPDSLDV